jgi:glycerol uptake facilitator-like aquaporin
MEAEPRGAGQFDAASMPVPDALPTLAMRLAAEAVGSGLLTFLVVAAGLLAERQAGSSIALAVLITALAGAAGFFLLTRALSPWAASLFNPALALAFTLSGRVGLVTGIFSAAAQIAAAFLGVMLAHLVTNTGLVQVATQIQTGEGVWVGEFLGTGLFVFASLRAVERSPERLPLTGAFCLLAISLATPSTSFANPAVTLARALTDSFTAIRLNDALWIAAMQMVAVVAAVALYRWLRPRDGV